MIENMQECCCMKLRLPLLLLVFVLLGAGCQKMSDQSTEATKFGISLTPQGFDSAAFERFMVMANEAGGTLSWAGEGSELAAQKSAASVMLGLSKDNHWTPVVIAGMKATAITDARKRASLQEVIVGFAKREQPPYLGIGNEINFAMRSAEQREAMIAFFDETAKQVKAASPNTKVFPIFQLEWMKGLHGGLFGGTNTEGVNDWDLLAKFPRADLIAFTSYPGLIEKNPSDIKDDYFSDIRSHTDKPVAFTEIGWFRQGPSGAAGWESSETEQADFIKKLPSLLALDHPVFVIWPFLYDQKIGLPFEHMGFLSPSSTTSEGWEAWKRIVK